VVGQQEKYRRSGFALAWRNLRFGGIPTQAARGTGAGLVDARTVPMDRLLRFDRALFPAPRPAFLASWIASPGTTALARLDEGGIVGFGAIRPCRVGMKIGPLYADGRETAELLFGALTAVAGHGPVFLDVPEPNRDAVALAEAAGLTPQFETARMYAGPAPVTDLRRLFGITSFELG
jgi:hypothetical protein